MAFNQAHWDIDYGAETVTNLDSGTGANLPHDVSGTHQGDILDFFKWLAGEFASSGQMDDAYPIKSDTPTVFAWLGDWGFGHADDYKYLTGGDITSADGQDAWYSLYTIGTPKAGTQFYITQADTEIPIWWFTDNIDVLIHVKQSGVWQQSVDTSGTPTDGGVWIYGREYGDKNNHAFVNLYNGRSPIGLDTSEDKANATAQATVGAYGITIGSWGTYSHDLNNGQGSKDYDVEIDCNGKTMDEVYEYLKMATSYLHGISINGDDGKEYRSADEGNYPEIKEAPFGTIAGGTLYGAQGIWFTNYASASFVLIASDGSEQAPPDLQKVIASHSDLDGSVSTDGGCNIFVAEVVGDGGAIIKNKYTVSSATATSITATLSIQANRTLQSGIIRVGDVQYAYTGFSGSTFTGVTPDASGLTNEDFYTPLMGRLADSTVEQSDNLIYDDTPFWVITSVRRYGTKPYDVYTQFGSNGLPFTPILADDPQAT